MSEKCLNCLINDYFALATKAEAERTAARRAAMGPFERYLDERIEVMRRNLDGRVLHEMIYGDYYAPAGGPNADVGSPKPRMCYCEEVQ